MIGLLEIGDSDSRNMAVAPGTAQVEGGLF